MSSVTSRVSNPIAWRTEQRQDGSIFIESDFSVDPICWTVHPLPLRHVAILRSDLPTRRSGSAHPLPITLDSWRDAWRSLSPCRVFTSPHFIFQSTHNARTPSVLVMGETLKEDCTLEYKLPTSSHFLTAEMVTNYHNSQQLSLLSTKGCKEFLFGVHDSSQTVIGMNSLVNIDDVEAVFRPFFQETYFVNFHPLARTISGAEM